jgi:iron(III) transport system substrate-binding protein
LYSADPVGLAYNTTLVDPNELPDNWLDLSNAKWKGVLSIDSNGSPWSLVSPAWGHDETIAYVDGLIAQVDPVVIGGSTNGLLSLTAGETSLRPAQFEAVEEIKADGAPVEWAALDPVIMDRTPWWMLAGSEHPNAARLFMIWQATSEEAQAVARQFYASNAGTSIIPNLPAGIPIVQASTPEEFATVTAVATELTETLSAGQ